MALTVAQTLSAKVAKIPFKATTKIQLLIDPTGSILLDQGGNAIGVIYPPS